MENKKRVLKKSIISDIPAIYSAFLNLAVMVSSFFFLFWFLSIFFFKLDLVYILVIVLFLSVFVQKAGKDKKIRKTIDYLRKVVILLGTTLFLFLFANLYLKLFDFINQQFLVAWQRLEFLLNRFVFYGIFIVVFIPIYFYLIFHVILFVTERLKIKKRVKYIITAIVILLAAIFSLTIGENLLHTFIAFSYSKLNWAIGFSLIFLHLNYLIREIKKVVVPVG